MIAPFSLPFPPQNPPIYPSLFSSKFMAYFSLFDVICIYIYIHKYIQPAQSAQFYLYAFFRAGKVLMVCKQTNKPNIMDKK